MALSRMLAKLQCCSSAPSVSGASAQPRKALSRCAVPCRSCTGVTVSPGQLVGTGMGHAGAHLVQLLVGDI